MLSLRCINGKNCAIAVGEGGAFLSRLHPDPYCIPCYQRKYPGRSLPRAKSDNVDLSMVTGPGHWYGTPGADAR